MRGLSWSGGKDAAMALQSLGRDDVDWLLTTVSRPFDRITMHGVRRSLLEAQARSIGLPVAVVELPRDPSNGRYDAAMLAALAELKGAAERPRLAFGDIFLEDVRGYREELLGPTDFVAEFPLWGRDTAVLADELVADGFEAIVVCVDTEQLDPAFLGRSLDTAFFTDLPRGVDPCGENGEFHTFVYDGPVFSTPVSFRRGRIEERERFHFLDLVPDNP